MKLVLADIVTGMSPQRHIAKIESVVIRNVLISQQHINSKEDFMSKRFS